MSWVLIAAASIVSGALGAMGLGGGGILLLVLVWAGLPQMTAQGINLLMILPVGALGLYFHHRNGLTDGRTAFPILLGGLPSVLLGVLLGTIRQRTGRVWPGWVLHTVNNLLVFAAG